MQPLTKQYSPIWQSIKVAKSAKIQLHKGADIAAIKRALKRLKYEDARFKTQCLAHYGYCLELAFSTESIAGNEEHMILTVQLVDKRDKVNNILL